MTRATDNEVHSDPQPVWETDNLAVQRFVYERMHALAHGQLKGEMRFAQTTSLVSTPSDPMVPHLRRYLGRVLLLQERANEAVPALGPWNW